MQQRLLEIFSKKLVKLKDMDKFLDLSNLTRLNQDPLEYLNRPITIKEIEMIVKVFPKTKRDQAQMD